MHTLPIYIPLVARYATARPKIFHGWQLAAILLSTSSLHSPSVLIMPRRAEIKLQRGAGDVEAEQRQQISAQQRQERGEEELAARDKWQRVVAEVRDVDVLEAGDEEEGALRGVSWF
jgi:hypothetical protein